ncbi:hypothetical protein NTHI1209_00454 [Haemophilus influenzae]|uniref:Uncharacterized protein n=1 Tax=Haemophilus influenzae TaxID=727 RepID=A0A158SVF7_HAEIF|nr:hypothetical protein NTHI1209_00454 [Haemophilus influenzae]
MLFFRGELFIINFYNIDHFFTDYIQENRIYT